MSSNFQSHSTYVPAPQAMQAPHRELMTETGGTVSININGGSPEITEKGHTSYKGEAPTTWQGTASNASGYRVPAHQINEETFVELNGLHARVDHLISAGMLFKNSDGTFSEATPEPESLQPETDPEVAALPEGVVEAINEACEPMPDHAIDNAVAVATRVAVGKADLSDIAKAIASPSGLELGEANARVQFVIDQYQAQTDAYLANRGGIAPSEVQEFYTWAKSNDAHALQSAMRSQLHGSMAGWKSMAQTYQSRKGRI